jgi:hypothetical protein
MQRPLLAVDVDGVISLFGFEEPPPAEIATFEMIDGMVHCISKAAGDRLRRLGDHFEPFWASGWEARANDVLPFLLGIPQLPYVRFDGAARFGTAHWKMEPIEAHARGRALAWIDDSLDETCFEWASRRQEAGEPTLLVPTESAKGLEEAQTEALISWAAELSREPHGAAG